MGVSAKRGSFAANTVTGDQAISGLGFTPKLVIFLAVGRTAVGQAQGDLKLCLGAASGSGAADQWALSRYVQDNVASSNAGMRSDSKCIIMASGPNTVDGEASLVSLDSDGFTINWSNAVGSAFLIEYIAIGGSGVDAKVFRYSHSTAAVGTDVAVTGVGFTPKALIVSTTGAAGAVPQGDSAQMIFTLGAAGSAASEAWVAATQRDNQAASSAGQSSRQHLLGSPSVVSIGTIDWEDDLLTFDSDGFTYDIANGGAGADVIYAIALGGADLLVDFRAVAQPTSTGTTDVTVGFAPKALLGFGGSDLTAFAGSNALDDALQIGLADSSSEASVFWRDVDAADPMDVSTGHSQTKFLRVLDAAQATLAECDHTVDSDGYELVWTTVDAIARQVFVLAIGSPPPTGAASAATRATSSGQKNAQGSASASARPLVTAIAAAEAASDTASVSAAARVTASGAVGPPAGTARMAMVI